MWYVTRTILLCTGTQILQVKQYGIGAGRVIFALFFVPYVAFGALSDVRVLRRALQLSGRERAKGPRSARGGGWWLVTREKPFSPRVERRESHEDGCGHT